MIDDIVKRIDLMASYANKFVYNYGVTQLKSHDVLSTRKLFIINNSSYDWGFYNRIDKEIFGDIHYITNVEHSDVERSPDFDCYEVKSDIDTCESASNLKRRIRDMIKNPQDYIKIN